MFTQDQITEAAKIFPEKKDGKQIIGLSRICEPGKAGINRYTLEDGSEVVEDDSGSRTDSKNKALKFPGV